MMDLVASWWSQNGWTFVCGSLACTALGVLAVAAARAPVNRQRWAEAAVGALVIWMLLAVVPVHRIAAPAPSPGTPWFGGELLERPLAVPPRAGTVTAVVDSFDSLAGLGFVLGIGLLLFTVYLLVAAIVLARLRWRASPAPEALHNFGQSLPLAPRRLRIALSRDTVRPFCCGLLRPMVVLPQEFAKQPPRELRPVLLHEFAHLAQGDLRGQVLFALALPLCFWNPLYWWLRKEARLCAEYVADDLAVRHFDKATYVRKLIDFAESTPTRSDRHVATLAVLGRESEFFRRMKMLIKRQGPISSSTPGVQAFARRASAVALACTAALLWVAPELTAQEPQERPAPPANQERCTAKVAYKGDAELGALVRTLANKGLLIKALDAKRGTMTFECAAGSVEQLQSWIGDRALLLEVRPHPVATSKPPRNSNQGTKPSANAPRVYFAFEDCDVRKIIDSIAKISGANIVIGPEVKGKASVRLRNVSWRTALAAAVEPLGYVVTDMDHGIVHISAPKPGK